MVQDKPLKVLCIGAGAIGLLAGGATAAQGAQVTFLVKPGQEKQLTGQTIQILNGDRILEVANFSVISSLARLDPQTVFDFIFIAVKAFDTESVIAQINNGAVNFRAILDLQNGVENEDEFKDAFPRAEIVGASVVSAVSRLDTTRIRVEKNRGIGLSGPQAFVQPINDIFEACGLRPQVFTDLRAMKWSKMLSNLFSNATSGILDMPPSEIYADRDLFRIEKTEILETAAVMRNSGWRLVNLPGLPLRPLVFLMRVLPDFLLQPLLKKMVAGGRGEKMPSFYIEKMKGSTRSEVNDLNGAVARRGSEIGIDTPVNEALTDVFNRILQDEALRKTYSGHPEKLVATIQAGNRI